MVIGVICIVLGALGVLTYGVCGTFGQVSTSLMSNSGVMQAPVMQAQVVVQQQYAAWAIVKIVVLAGLGVVLLIGGIMCVRRRKAVRPVLLTWAGLRLAFLVPAAFIDARYYEDLYQAFQSAMNSDPNAGTMPQGLLAMMQWTGPLGIVVGALFAAVLPTFLVFWLLRAKVRGEIASW